MSIQLMVMDLNSAYCHYIQREKKTPQWQEKYAVLITTNPPRNSNGSIQEPRGKKMYLLLHVLMVYKPMVKEQRNLKNRH